MAFETLADIRQIDMAEESEEYAAFVDKFKPKHTTDDCFTPDNIYEVVKGWALKRYGLPASACLCLSADRSADRSAGLPEDVRVIRPFYPGGDYQREEYPDGCVVIDNPPFSIAAQIADFYQAHGIRFFLFANGLTAGSIAWSRQGLTAVCTGAQITYDNGARVNTGYITNLSPDILVESAPDLHDALEAADKVNRAAQAKQVTKLSLPDHIVTAARMNYLAVHGTAWRVKAGDGIFVRKLDNYAGNIFGGGLLLPDAIAAERAAAERAAAERAAAERAVALKVPLSDREKALVRTMAKG